MLAWGSCLEPMFRRHRHRVRWSRGTGLFVQVAWHRGDVDHRNLNHGLVIRPGPHRLFKYDPRLARYGKNVIMLPDLPGLEIRIGGLDGPLQSNCPPTKGTDGKPREWNGCDVVAELPEAVFSFLDNHGAADPVEEFEGSANLEHPVEAITLPNSPIRGGGEVPANSDPYLALITASWGRLKSDDKRRLAEIVMDCISGIKV